MAQVTLRILDGADRGRIFEKIETPLTIGREEGNTIMLDDDRISRFHVKIQEDQDKLVLTDLTSTNGSKVNGEDIQIRILRFGDMISLGRSVLLYGSREQIAERLAMLRRAMVPDKANLAEMEHSPQSLSLDFELCWSSPPDGQKTLHNLEPPEIPDGLSPGQMAQVSEIIEYLHVRIRDLLKSVKSKGRAERITLEMRHWQSLLDLQACLAGYLKSIGDPNEDEEMKKDEG